MPLIPARIFPQFSKLLNMCFKQSNLDKQKNILISFINFFLMQNPYAYIDYLSVIDINMMCAIDAFNSFPKNSEIYLILLNTNKSNVGKNLYKCSKISEKYPYYNKTLAYNFMKMSAEYGYNEGRKYFFLMVLFGYLFNPSKKEAFKLAKKWSDMGDINSAVLLAHCYERGIGCPKDRPSAFILLEKNRKTSNLFEIKYEYSKCLTEGIATLKDVNAGKAYLTDACLAADKDEIYNYAKFLYKSGFSTPKQIIELLNQISTKNPKVNKFLQRIQITNDVDSKDLSITKINPAPDFTSIFLTCI